MALFGPSKDQIAGLKNELMQKLSSNEYIDLLIHEILTKAGKEPIGEDEKGDPDFDTSNPWITTCQSYYDDRKRRVIVGPDSICVAWSTFHTEFNPTTGANMQVEDVIQEFGYAFTKDGYVPLSAYTSSTGSLSRSEVIYGFTSIVRERMQSVFPELEFDIARPLLINGSRSTDDEHYFEFTVPALTWKQWF